MQQLKITRRKLLKLSGGLLAAIPFTTTVAPALAEQPDPVILPAWLVARHMTPISGLAEQPEPIILPAKRPFGRVIQGGLLVRELPSLKAERVRVLKLNEVITIKGQTSSDESPTTYNKTWYQTDDGFVYSAFVQPAENSFNTPLTEVGENGFWGEITVPLAEARNKPGTTSHLRYRYYYGSVFKIIRSVANVIDGQNEVWYQIGDEYAGNGFYVQAEHVRPIPITEFAPISPDVPLEDKRMEVDLVKQLATAFEGDNPVYSARVATGASIRLSDGTIKNYGTTRGQHRIFMKLPSQHMVGGAASDGDFYDLPGIGWVSYFTSSGIAFHGTYWHNDYGRPRSHGCVNMLPEDAKWVFLWTLPTASYEERRTRTTKRTDGSLVKVY